MENTSIGQQWIYANHILIDKLDTFRGHRKFIALFGRAGILDPILGKTNLIHSLIPISLR
jgi:hypothetical protein